MTSQNLKNARVVVFATDGFEELELTEPLRVLRENGANVDIVSIHAGEIQAYRHHDKSIKIQVDRTLDEVSPDHYDALVLPGGTLNADTTRIDPTVQKFVQAFQTAGKPMAVICHAPWILVSSGLVKGRNLTSYKTIQDDIKNAGGNWSDQAVIVDKNWVTSRQPSDLPDFNREMIRLISENAFPVDTPT